ncbi:MmcQ/YjbR family DNA-binding protein [Streptomyces sp. NPDC052020]|uniref:MmcQ/YjbR family DNA-binding protein n=1 Tax=Streptomyces sp. NPDC052020 TaxID=3155677 RepID=UPI003443872D
MNGSTLQTFAAECAERLPGARLEHPFGPDWEVFKVHGKVFMLMTSVPGEPVVILKSEPGEAEALREAHADVTRGYHMNKRHWITLEGGDSLDKKLVEELVTESYRLVVGNLPRTKQPVDPETYGTHARAARR